MRILLVSDIHGNQVALEAVLGAAPPHDAIWCLGDVVGYGPAPNECCERLQALKVESLAGNHDWAVTGHISEEYFNDIARIAIDWTREHLSASNLAWLDGLTPLRELPEYDLTLVHASPRAPVEEYIESGRQALENFSYLKTGLCLFGHTHVPALHQLLVDEKVLRSRTLEAGETIPLRPRMLVNPGSVGQPRDGDPRAAYAILDLDARTIELFRLEYDIAETQAAMRRAKLPERLAIRLQYGR